MATPPNPASIAAAPITVKHCPYHATMKQQHRRSVYDRETPGPRCLWYFACHAAKIGAVAAAPFGAIILSSKIIDRLFLQKLSNNERQGIP